MELLQLRYFFDSAKNENFSKTADKYMVPPSSVSAAVKRLETELGYKLFDRTDNRILLNENGKRLQQSLCIVFDELDKAVDSFHDPADDQREIRLLVRTLRSRITDYIIECKTKYPNMKFIAEFNYAIDNFEAYDVIISANDDRLENYGKIELYTHRMCVKASANSTLRDRSLTLSQLSNQPFITMGQGSASHEILFNVCRRAGFTPNIVMICDDSSCYRKLLEENIGIGIGSESSLSEKTVKLDVTDFEERQTVYAYCKPQADCGNVKRFLNFLRSKAV